MLTVDPDFGPSSKEVVSGFGPRTVGPRQVEVTSLIGAAFSPRDTHSDDPGSHTHVGDLEQGPLRIDRFWFAGWRYTRSGGRSIL